MCYIPQQLRAPFMQKPIAGIAALVDIGHANMVAI